MSVYTFVEAEDLVDFLAPYHVGTLEGYQILPGGTVNSNYYIHTSDGEYVLTLFETLKASEVDTFMQLLIFLDEQGLPGATPVARKDGSIVQMLNQRPTTLVHFLQGRSPKSPSSEQCYAIGEYLGKLHQCQVPECLPANKMGKAWRESTAELLLPLLPKVSQTLLSSLMERPFPWQGLPMGLIHGDLFRDNTLFVGDRLSGAIDFYFACKGPWLFDLAVTVNDWCVTPSGKTHVYNSESLLDGYQQIRSLTAAEHKAWPEMQLLAALRFWLSRLDALYLPQKGTQVLLKDPQYFEKRLNFLLKSL